ncbi:hypothetical protein [Streptomyces sp. NPDC051364]|uniref:hypothetical protein n=1 Tax=Streptomyces sp. NPDC051364 TaxID=3155799 RepID=UPI00341C43FC
MDKKFEGFLTTYLDTEQAYDTSGYLRPALMAFNESYVQVIRDGFNKILQDPDFGPAEYERLTNIEFPDSDSLRQYLRDMYSYLFEDAPTQPAPPE